jgi:hypothetical protein
MAQRKNRIIYNTISVTPETFVQVKLIADANDRGLGDQVKYWAKRELPECMHEKQAVSIETFPGNDSLVTSVIKQAWYCPTCKRVYAKVSDDAEPVIATMKVSHA